MILGTDTFALIVSIVTTAKAALLTLAHDQQRQCYVVKPLLLHL